MVTLLRAPELLRFRVISSAKSVLNNELNADRDRKYHTRLVNFAMSQMIQSRICVHSGVATMNGDW